jgi:hypothetical protein
VKSVPAQTRNTQENKANRSAQAGAKSQAGSMSPTFFRNDGFSVEPFSSFPEFSFSHLFLFSEGPAVVF